MNSGDGWYGGVYVAAMYALAFVSRDVGFVVEEALKTIPSGTTFARAMIEVIRAHRENPADWKAAWRRVQSRFGSDIGCPEGVLSKFDIDAKINCAWVVLGLLYGDGNFGKTLSLSTRCGDDSDCNPATAGGILGTMLGFSGLDPAWTQGLADIDRKPFPFTSISLQDAVRLSAGQALENIRRNGGRVRGADVELAVQTAQPVRTEIAFAGHVPVERRRLNIELRDEVRFSFDGIGFAVNGAAVSEDGRSHVLKAEMTIDGRPAAAWDLPTDSRVRNPTPFWAYELRPGHHEVRLRIARPDGGAFVKLEDAVIYAPGAVATGR
jgi:hypothetical protein